MDSIIRRYPRINMMNGFEFMGAPREANLFELPGQVLIPCILFCQCLEAWNLARIGIRIAHGSKHHRRNKG
jgi:hypothetical protein